MSKSYRFDKNADKLEKLFAKSKAKKVKAFRKEAREAKMFAYGE